MGMFQMTKLSSLTFFSIVVFATATQCHWCKKAAEKDFESDQPVTIDRLPACISCRRQSRCCECLSPDVFRTAAIREECDQIISKVYNRNYTSMCNACLKGAGVPSATLKKLATVQASNARACRENGSSHDLKCLEGKGLCLEGKGLMN